MNVKEKELLEKIFDLLDEMTEDTKELEQGLTGINSSIQAIGNGVKRIEATQKDIIEELKQQLKR
jgi:archaellum component FlaC